ncbi:MAG: hypothetical protein J6D61_07505 [Clostridia bacterium]|nr:hypothetical protein [Clostridia bacterium]
MSKSLDRKRKNGDPNNINLIKAALLGLGAAVYFYEIELFGKSTVLAALGYIFIMFASMYLVRYLNNRRK